MQRDRDGVPPPSTSPARLMDKPSGRSMFGRQADSRKRTACVPAFGSGTRETREKLFLTSTHAAIEQRCKTSPGAIYHAYSSLQRQVASTNRTSPGFHFSHDPKIKQWPGERTPGPGKYPTASSFENGPHFKRGASAGFGTSNRQHKSRLFMSKDHNLELLLRDGAPVGTYETPPGFGVQRLSRCRTQPAFSTSRAPRLRGTLEETARKSPGAGQYPTWASMGKQMKSNFKTMPSYGFGSCVREQQEKRFLTNAHTRVLQGTHSPSGFGHQQEGTLTSLGKQPKSCRTNAPCYGFGTSKKMVFKVAATPGPGTYEN